MRGVRRSLAIGLSAWLTVPAVHAQDHVISTRALDLAVQERVNREQSDRDAIAALLQRSDVRKIASTAGLSIQKAEAGVAMLRGADLERIAAQARAAQDDLAGGASTVTISTTTIIIILLIVILIVVIAD
jgi:hypothetical protein